MKLAGTKAVTELWAKIKAYIATKLASYLPLSGGTLTGNLEFADPGTDTTKGIYGTVGTNDAWRLIGGATAFDSGWVELATADGGNEPIYVRQYTYLGGAFGRINRTATLLDAAGNTSFPGTVTASAFSGNASSATTATQLDGYYTTIHYDVAGGFYGNICVPVISNEGVMEVGKCIDFHIASTSQDYATRIICNSAPGNVVSLPGASGALALTTDNVASATKATQDGSGNVIADSYLKATRIETSYETNMTGKVVAFGRYYSTGSKSNVHITRETFITADGLAWVLSDTPVAYSNRLKSSAWDWEGEGPQGNGTTVKKIATITGLGYVRLEGNNVIGTAMSRSNWKLDISVASSSVTANATATNTVTFGYTYESGVLTLYLGERYGENTYNMFASEVMAGAAITWENSSVAAIAMPSGYISI